MENGSGNFMAFLAAVGMTAIFRLMPGIIVWAGTGFLIGFMVILGLMTFLPTTLAGIIGLAFMLGLEILLAKVDGENEGRLSKNKNLGSVAFLVCLLILIFW